MPARQRRAISPAWVSIGLTVLLNIIMVTYQSGRLNERVNDIADQLKELKEKVSKPGPGCGVAANAGQVYRHQ